MNIDTKATSINQQYLTKSMHYTPAQQTNLIIQIRDNLTLIK